MSKYPFYVGEGLAGDGNEIAHIDLMLGDKNGIMGTIFGNTLSRQSEGHTNLLAVLAPNKAVKPDTVTFTKVTMKNIAQALQMFGPAQAAVAWAVGDALVAGDFKNIGDPESLCLVVGVFIHPAAKENEKILEYNYTATRLSIQRAVAVDPSVEDVKKWVAAGETDKDLAHPFIGKDVSLANTLKKVRQQFTSKT